MERNTMNIENISGLIKQLKTRMKKEGGVDSDLETLDNIFCNHNFEALIQIYKTFQSEHQSTSLTSVNSNACGLAKDIHEIRKRYPDNDTLEVLSIMFDSSPHLMALLSCHDKVANKAFDVPQLSDIPFDNLIFNNEDGEESIKVVRLVKSDEPLGATIAADEVTGNITVARILKGGAADRSGLIHVNDVLVEINGVEAKGKKPSDLIKLLAGFKGPLTFKLIPGETAKKEVEENMYARCRFTYIPQSDNLMPCVEAGLAFYPGDILCILSKDDPSWWQATKIESSESALHGTNKVGLIPTMKLQIRREKLQRQAEKKSSTAGSVKGSNLSLMSSGRKNAWNMIRSSFRRKRNSTSPPHSLGSTKRLPHFPPYEVVGQYVPSENTFSEAQSRTYRPIVLVGPQGVGRNELKDRLIDSNPSHYGVPVPHTSRAKHGGEEDGKDYHFVTREYMENGIKENHFLEYGEYKGNLYGTSLEAVRYVIKAGQVCVLTPYPQALPLLRTKEFKSCIVFIKPPSVLEMGKLDGVENFQNMEEKVAMLRPGRLPFTAEEMKSLVSRSEKMESMYGRLFDKTIINDNSDRAFMHLKELSFSLENDSQWVPIDWLS